MSTLEKTIHLLRGLSENQIEIIYSYVLFLNSQNSSEKTTEPESLDEIFKNIVGTVPDSGKSLEDYHEERVRERYEFTD